MPWTVTLCSTGRHLGPCICDCVPGRERRTARLDPCEGGHCPLPTAQNPRGSKPLTLTFLASKMWAWAWGWGAAVQNCSNAPAQNTGTGKEMREKLLPRNRAVGNKVGETGRTALLSVPDVWALGARRQAQNRAPAAAAAGIPTVWTVKSRFLSTYYGLWAVLHGASQPLTLSS